MNTNTKKIIAAGVASVALMGAAVPAFAQDSADATERATDRSSLFQKLMKGRPEGRDMKAVQMMKKEDRAMPAERPAVVGKVTAVSGTTVTVAVSGKATTATSTTYTVDAPKAT